MKKLFLLIFILNAGVGFAGKKKKTITNLAQLKQDIYFLASDSLEGRRTGSAGELLAANYIANRFAEMGLAPYFKDGNYKQNFIVAEGNELTENNSLSIFNNKLSPSDFAPLPFSANGNVISLIMNKFNERENGVLLYCSNISKEQLNNPHGNAMADYKLAAEKEINLGATAVYICNDIDSTFDYNFSSKNEAKPLGSPVIFINYNAYKQRIKPNLQKEWLDISGEVEIAPKSRTGINVAAYINNNAKSRVIIGAHYDHLGYGQDHNSTYTGSDIAIHNGADDNASGVGAILQLAQKLKTKPANHNYIIVAFSGEELGLYGSKKFIEQNESALENANYMVNIDMLGRFDETKNALTIGGVGTSPSWIPTIQNSKPFFVPKWDSAGIGPSDHTSFYLKDLPVLFFFTGLHTDYHKPSDDADKINFEGELKIIDYIYSLIQDVNKLPKLQFTKTAEPKMGTASFKVTLGIMPDYTFSGVGVKADGIISGKAAEKAGLQANDVIIRIGQHNTQDIQAYMQALGKFKKGDTTKVKILRGEANMELELTF